MRANLFFFFCVGFLGAVVLSSMAPLPFFVHIGAICAVLCAVAFAPQPAKWYALSCVIGFTAGILRLVFLPDVLPLSFSLLATMAAWLRTLSQNFGSVFGKLYPEPIAGFAQGILTGNAGIRLDPGFMQALRTTSTLHLIAVSGYNVTLVSSYAYRLLHWLTVPRKMIWVMVLVSLAGFTAFVGAPASAVRASIMASLVVIAQRFYRTGYGRNALLCAAILMLLWQPSTLFDLGFQLSFLATAGIMFVAPRVTQRFSAKPIDGLTSIVIETVSAQAFVLPVLILKSGTLSLLGFAANVVILPLIPAAMALSALAGVGFFLLHGLGWAIAFVSMPFFLFMTQAIKVFASLPFAAVQIGPISFLWIGAYYAAIIIWLLQGKQASNHA